jgi:hypothetical protein
MEYLKEIILYLSLPLTVYIAYRFVLSNLNREEK